VTNMLGALLSLGLSLCTPAGHVLERRVELGDCCDELGLAESHVDLELPSKEAPGLTQNTRWQQGVLRGSGWMTLFWGAGC
jgi:hypothetical protein